MATRVVLATRNAGKVHELRQILESLAQRRQAQREHAQAVPEVLAKRAVLDHLMEIAVRCSDDAHVDVQRA